MAQDKSEALRCLEWAYQFAQGSRDADPSLRNPVFEKWLADCRAVLEAGGIDPDQG